MYIHEEEKVDAQNLAQVINETQENVKYLPGHKIPANIVCKVIY